MQEENSARLPPAAALPARSSRVLAATRAVTAAWRRSNLPGMMMGSTMAENRPAGSKESSSSRRVSKAEWVAQVMGLCGVRGGGGGCTPQQAGQLAVPAAQAQGR